MSAYLVSVLLALTAWVGPALARGTGHAAWSYLSLLITFGLIPIGDRLFKEPEPENHPTLGHDLILYAGALMHCSLIVWSTWRFALLDLGPAESLGMLLSVGLLTGGMGITFAHELVHRRNAWQRRLGELILIFVCYGHFAVEHVFGHHLHVATPRDPVSAARGISFYRFYPRAVFGSFLSGYRLKPGRVLRTTLASAALAAAFALLWGPKALAFFLAQSLIAFSLLEGVDYIEHYGLRRRLLPTGRYEPFQPWHSWDAKGALTNRVLINLQRHADHHLHPLKHYETLSLTPKSPLLPYSYPIMILIALVPALWMRLMNPKLDAQQTSPGY